MPPTKDGNPTESSPLLGTAATRYGKDLSNNVSTSAVPETDIDNTTTNLERQTTHESIDEARAAQFRGDEEVQKKLKFIIPTVSLGVLLAAADQTIVITSYARIGSELEALNSTSWIATAYFLSLTTFQPLYGKLSDIFGRKTCLLFAYGIFGLGGLGCGLAHNMSQLIAFRAIQGVGGGGLTTVVSILLSDIVPLKERGVYQGIINIVYATGAASGAPLGGLLADSVGWRWAFFGQVPICAIGFLAICFLLKLPAQDQKHLKDNLKRVDFLGATLLIGAVFCLIFGLDRGSNIAWSVPISFVPLLSSVILTAAFILVENRFADDPFVPGHIIFHRAMISCYLCYIFSFSGWFGAQFYFPLLWQAVDGISATAASLRWVPAILFGVTGSLCSGLVMRKTGRYYWLTVFSYSLVFCGTLIFTTFSGVIVNSTLGLIIGTCLCALGNGSGVTTSLIALLANAAPEDQAVVTACSYLFRSLGSVIGISLSTTVVNLVLRSRLSSVLGSGKHADEIIRGVRASLDYIKTLDPETASSVRRSYGQAIQSSLGLNAILVSGAVICSLFIIEKRIGK